METESEEAEAFERTPEYCNEDSIERWIELKRSGCVFFDNGHIEDKVEKLLEENKTLRKNNAEILRLSARVNFNRE